MVQGGRILKGWLGLLAPEGFMGGGGFRSALVLPLLPAHCSVSVPAMALKHSELLLLAQGAGSCWAVRRDFQLMWRLRRTGAMLLGRW